MTTDQLLDHLLIPRANGSPGLEQVARFLGERLHAAGAVVSQHAFTATPHGFQLVWTAALLLGAGYVAAIATRRYLLALVLIVASAGMLMAEFEYLHSPVSGLLPATERNVVGTFPGQPGGPTLLFTAHYDTTTHFGDHFSWGRWGALQGPGSALAVGLALAGLWLGRRGRRLPRALVLPLALLAVTPFAAMFWFQSLGPLLRAPSPGAIDNGGSLAALLQLADQLSQRPVGAEVPTTVQIVFLAAEEERALGSWAFAQELPAGAPLAVVNLESIGASDELSTIPEDGFATRRFRSSDAIVALVNDTAWETWGGPLPSQSLPFGTLTDGRSFLAHGIPTITLRSYTRNGSFPRRLHSLYDSRDRLVVPEIDRTAQLLRALVARVDAHPELVDALRRSPSP